MNKLTRSSDVHRLTRSRPPNISLEPPAVTRLLASVSPLGVASSLLRRLSGGSTRALLGSAATRLKAPDLR
jgi:hypothetical protein